MRTADNQSATGKTPRSSALLWKLETVQGSRDMMEDGMELKLMVPQLLSSWKAHIGW